MFQKSIYVFDAVVRNGSFSKAAKELMVSQSAVSQQIEKLEKEVGVKLFDRDYYRPTCTEAGKRYHEMFMRMVAEYEATREELLKDQEKHLLTIGITGPFENRHVPVILRECIKEYSLKTVIQILMFQEVVEKLDSGELDLAFGLANDFENHPNLKYHVIWHSKLCIVASRDHWLSQYDSVDIHEIVDEPILILSKSWGDRFYEDFMSGFTEDKIKPNIVRECDNLAEILVGARLNEGIALLSTEVVESEPELKTIAITGTHRSADYVIGYNINNNNKYVAPVLDAAISYFDNLRKEEENKENQDGTV